MQKLKTRWSGQIDPNHVLEEYPRPTMVRESYVNLNGKWQYAITNTPDKPAVFDGEILVPFSPEAELSGVNRQLMPGQYLWYRRELPTTVARDEDKRWLLHFGAVDQYAKVWINGEAVAEHLGGYLPFSADVTQAVHMEAGKNELLVMVIDDSDSNDHSRGKQCLQPGGMFYTAQSGIWQTVWMEEVPKSYIQELKITPNYDKKMLEVKVFANENVPVEIEVSAEGMQPFAVDGASGTEIQVPIKDMHSWTPEDPFLYDLKITLKNSGQTSEEAINVVDEVTSYAAMRKISAKKDAKGIPRLYLNNEPYFQVGVLDQGYWPDGLYTAPCDEAMLYDIRLVKKMGFNMIRKHIKIEPQRWYYHCDKEGMLVWQDMVCGGSKYKFWFVTYMATALEQLNIRLKDHMLGMLGRKNPQGREQFVREMRETMRVLYNHPSIVTWVIFNEGWGQFHADKVTKIAREIDQSRLLDQASGWFDQGGGDYRSIHNYFFRFIVKAEERRVIALTECGGYSWGIDGHRMHEKIYGYKVFDSREALTKGYVNLMKKNVIPNIKKGLSAIVYTQLSDVEEEVNGLVTYDREQVKVTAAVVRKINAQLKY